MIFFYYVLFHVLGMMFFCFGLLMLVIYMAKYMKKEDLFKFSLAAVIAGFLLIILGFALTGWSIGDGEWSMMNREYNEGKGMMNWDKDSDKDQEKTSDSGEAESSTETTVPGSILDTSSSAEGFDPAL